MDRNLKIGWRFHAAALLLLSLLHGHLPVAPAIAQGTGNSCVPSTDFSDTGSLALVDPANAINWSAPMGTWRDADGVPQGRRPFGVIRVTDIAGGERLEADVTALVTAWILGASENEGLLLIAEPGAAAATFQSLEQGGSVTGPILDLVYADGENFSLPATMDTILYRISTGGIRQRDRVAVGRNFSSYIYFELPAGLPAGAPERASLKLVADNPVSGEVFVGVYEARPERPPEELPPLQGIAAAFPNDRGIDSHGDVIFAEDFEAADWQSHWHEVGPNNHFARLAADSPLSYEKLSGAALLVQIPEGEHLGLNLSYYFRNLPDGEPEEIYFRYYLRFASNWLPATDGKLPGLAGTYGRAGWGGRRSDGLNGWSARGLWKSAGPFSRAPGPHIPVGNYVYHADMRFDSGDHLVWATECRGYIAPGRWVSLEQFIRLNDPGRANGILRAWVDGRPAYERTNLRLRRTPELKIERVWMNIYYGGRPTAPSYMHLYLDNVVIARSYIGPMKRVE